MPNAAARLYLHLDPADKALDAPFQPNAKLEKALARVVQT